ncbi:protein of unknown function [Meinhardsimonia xiamenensis]|uniref:YjiS-like domain-containing protein n=1 Tax=Meinhardsimonia xiamenensis TaxID=990712 RepID=A0A1G9CQ71_9RHOB|nr:DUF1127 domain-containing protein [Meinhardsimonia xiamenensis]PRX38282.1 uncharacterized protein DUF1127 [Meinhardsimonia xiamenensis]SDK53843.1 protein of unknown function [Meinhardsimonia xiamenensis]
MNGFFDQLRERARKRALYRRTVREIRSMPDSVARDLGIYRGEAERIAREAVYGQ